MIIETNSGIAWARRTLSYEEAVARVTSIIEKYPGINIYNLDRLANVAEFPDGILLPDLLRPLVDDGVVREGRSAKGAPTYVLAE